MEQVLEIGQIVNTNGIKGVVKVIPYTDDLKRFEALKTIYIEKDKTLQEFSIEEVKYSKQSVLLKLQGIDTIEQAQLYRNCYLKIKREDARQLPQDTYFIVDLIGIKVFTDEGKFLGELQDVFPTGSNDVYVVKQNNGKQILLPAIGEVVKEVDLTNRKMIVHLLPGLQEEEK